MDIIRRTIIWLALAIGLTSCSSLFYDLKSDVLYNIQKGMSKQEVIKLLGEPKFRRFDRDLDEWEYSKCLSRNGYTTIIVNFEDGKVVAMDSFATYDNPPVQSVTVAPNEVIVSPPHTIYTKGMPEVEFQRFYNKVKSRPFKDDQFEMIELGSNNSLSCNQCARLMSIYTFDDDKMRVLRLFAPRIADRENYEEILNVLDSLFKRDDAKKLLRIKN